MKYRKNKQEILAGLFEQKDLRKELALPPDIRLHYLSIVVLLPLGISRNLTMDALDWVKSWNHGCYYIQRTDSMHLTLAEIGSISGSQTPLQDIIRRTDNYLATNTPRKIHLKLTEAKIGSSGINCHIEPAHDEIEDWLEHFGREFPELKIKPLTNRSISLVRYLIPKPNFKDDIRDSLARLEPVDATYNQPIKLNELLLVRLDKVAQYFQALHQFKL
ncbi:MAG: hypothetical protein ACMUJM_17095 [bacterium]